MTGLPRGGTGQLGRWFGGERLTKEEYFADVDSTAPKDVPWSLPRGWRWERLRDVTLEPRRGNPSDRFPDNFRYVDVSSLEGETLTPRTLSSADAPSRARQFLEAGDTILSGVRVYLRNLALIADDRADVASTAFSVLRPDTGLDPRYLFRWASSDSFISRLIALQRGNSPPAVLDADVRDQSIPIPATIEDQRRIVARIDALFAEIEEGEQALAGARVGVDTHRNALLKAAVTGELTADWRLQHRCDDALEENGQIDCGNFMPKLPRTEGLPELPENWTYSSIEQLCALKPRNGLSIKEVDKPTSVRGLKLDALGSETVDWTRTRYLPRSLSDVEAYALCDGDILISRANGSPRFVGRASLCVDPPQGIIFPDTAIRYRLRDNCNLRTWALLIWNSYFVRSQIERLGKTSAGILKISQDDIASIAIPIPPFE